MDKKRFPNKKAVEEQKADLKKLGQSADLSGAKLGGANLFFFGFWKVNLNHAKLGGAKFEWCEFG